jgi:hypothetical protein
MASDDQPLPDLDGLAIWATPGLVTGHRGLLVLLVASASDQGDDRAALDAARRAGGVVGAQIRTHQTS